MLPSRSTAEIPSTSGGNPLVVQDAVVPGSTWVVHSPPWRSCKSQSRTASAPPEPHKPQTAMRIAPRESAVKGLLLVQLESDDLGRAVSRILSAPKTLGGENHLSQQPVPGTRSAARNLERAAPGSPIWPCTRWGFPCLRACAWSGGLLPHLFTLTSAPLPEPGRSEFLWHYPSGRLAASPPACIPRGPSCVGPRRLRGIAPYGVRTFLLPQVALGKAILRPSKIKATIPPCC